MEDRSKLYKKPFKFGCQSLYKSDTLSKIDLDHWKLFDEASKTEDGLKIGDFIENATRLTAQQMVDFLDEIKQIKSIEEIHKFADDRIIEFAKEIRLRNE